MPRLVEIDPYVSLFAQLEEKTGPVVLLNVFTVAPEETEALVAAWSADAAIMKRQPGFISRTCSARWRCPASAWAERPQRRIGSRASSIVRRFVVAHRRAGIARSEHGVAVKEVIVAGIAAWRARGVNAPADRTRAPYVGGSIR